MVLWSVIPDRQNPNKKAAQECADNEAIHWV
mgnify:CR=1 FL=1